MKSKKIIVAIVLFLGILSINAQTSDERYSGVSQTIPNSSVVLPYALEVTYEKTSHLIFPSPICYVDLGSDNLIAGKAEDAENVLRVKATVRDFETETNLSVICNDGSLYAFNVIYSNEPKQLTVEMQDFLHSKAMNRSGNLPGNKSSVYFSELGNVSPLLVQLIMKTIWYNNNREIKHIGSNNFGVQFLLRGLYTHNGLLYFHTLINNQSNIFYNVDFITFKVVDKKIAKRTAIQEVELQPVRSFNDVKSIRGNTTERSVFVLQQFTLPNDKVLLVTLFEQNGGRHQTFLLENEDLIRAKSIDHLKMKFQ